MKNTKKEERIYGRIMMCEHSILDGSLLISLRTADDKIEIVNIQTIDYKNSNPPIKYGCYISAEVKYTNDLTGVKYISDIKREAAQR